MKILFVTWELDPFFKMGGLGDIARSLPGALVKMGVDIRIVLPYYQVLKLGKVKKQKYKSFLVEYNGKKEKVEVVKVLHPDTNVIVYLLSNKSYLDFAESLETFAFFDKAIIDALVCKKLDFFPEIIHCNDHHGGLIPLLVRQNKLPIKTFFTIHNLAYQGIGSTDILDKIGVNANKCRVLKWEIESRRLNFIMEGIIHSNVVTTVSPTYAKEIMKEEYGMGLDEILRGKEGRVFGILNGIDYDFNIAMFKKSIKYKYRSFTKEIEEGKKVYSWEEGKKLNKILLQKKLGLKVGGDIPVFSFIGRFDPNQKGIDIIHRMLRRRKKENYQVVVLGSGNPELEERFQWLSSFYPKNISCNFKFDETLARQIYAGSDFILVPSKFEPCGLIQMNAMFFGTLPIARKTGGLADSVRDNINGFLFERYTSESLGNAVDKAIGLWKNNRMQYRMMVEAALNTDFSWKKSADKYLSLYNQLIKNEF